MYNNFNYISSETIVAEVKQELSSYFDSGLLTEVMIPTYIDAALRRLKLMALKYEEDIITVENYKAKLPKNFSYLKDIYLCTEVHNVTTPAFTTTYEYYKKTYCHDSCENEYETFEQTSASIPSWIVSNLKPVLLRVYYGSKAFCAEDCTGLSYGAEDVVKINKSTISTMFEAATLYIQYYSRPVDEHGPLIPEVIEIEDYVKAYLYYSFFNVLYNSITDESIALIERKREIYKQEYYSKLRSAENTLLEESRQEVRDNIRNQKQRFKIFMIN